MKLLQFSFCYLLFLLLFPVSPLANTLGDNINENQNNTVSFTSTLSPDERKWLAQQQSLTYVYDPNWAPFEWTNDIGQHTGIIADILNILQHKTGIEFVAIKTNTWAEAVTLAKSEKVDMYSAITINSDREKYLNFTAKDIYSYQAVLVTKFNDKTIYLDIKKDFKNKKIGIVKNSGLGSYIKAENPKLNFIEIPSTYEGFSLLASNEIDLFAINMVTARYFIEKKGFSDLKIALKLDYIYHLKIAVNKNLPKEIISILDKALSSISEDELNNIFNKWTEIITEKKTDWVLIMQTTGAFIFVILFFIWNTRRLKLLVRNRTEELHSLNKQLKKLANTDALTGLPNRRQLMNDFEYEAKRAHRYNRKMALFYMDLNKFKNVNDELGHETGDALLQFIAEKINNSLRENDIIYRVGGDEFCILIPEFINNEQLRTMANRVIKDVSQISNFHGKTIQIGSSIGIALFPDNGQNLPDLTSSADRAMYRIKTTQQNNFCFAE